MLHELVFSSFFLGKKLAENYMIFPDGFFQRQRKVPDRQKNCEKNKGGRATSSRVVDGIDGHSSADLAPADQSKNE